MPPAGVGDALLDNDNLTLDPASVADLRAGLIDPRIVAVLEHLARDHRITVSGMRSGHDRFTAGGLISSHQFGRGVDITAIDGVAVDAANHDARELAAALQELDGSIRPDEIGSPWAISGPGYFTDASHQEHLHIGFAHERTEDWTPPEPPEPPPEPTGHATARTLLSHARVVLEPDCAADLAADRVDPRVVALLARLARDHTITVSSLCSGHARFTAAGSVSSHHLGRAADITAIDGAPVNAGNAAAREIAIGLQRLEAPIRPDEIGTPWAIAGPGYWTDAAQQSHLHVGFARPIASGWTPPSAPPPEPAVAETMPTGQGHVPGAKALAALVEAEKHLDAPYRPGGSTPETGFDGSGLVQWAYAQAGIAIPRVASEQMTRGAPVERGGLLPGDLVFFRDARNRVGISLGGDRFIHVGDVVTISRLDEHGFAGARRLDPAGAGEAPDLAAVARAQAHVARDAAEVRRRGSSLYAAVEEQEGTAPCAWDPPR
jgi:cell wall-associated NlpC family hydrolase